MLYEFLIEHREVIIRRTQARVASRTCPKPANVDLHTNGIPAFLEQVGEALYLGRSSDEIDHEEIRASAREHGSDLLKMGFTVAQVVHDYGDVCQVVTELAVERNAPISAHEFRMLNLCLDDAIAGAVTEYARQREDAIATQGTERLGILAHELRNVMNVATLSFEIIKSGQVAAGGSTGLMHGRALMRLNDLIDRSLAEVRLDAGLEHVERISVGQFIEELEIGALIQAKARGLRFSVTSVDFTATIEGDRQVLVAAVTNLLQNAFKFTKRGGSVALTARATADRVLFEVEDECGGLPPGKVDELFLPFLQRGADRSGVGLGLPIVLKAAKANAGELRVRDLPGKGCVFTLDLPRRPDPVVSAQDTDEPHKSGMHRRAGLMVHGARLASAVEQRQPSENARRVHHKLP